MCRPIEGDDYLTMGLLPPTYEMLFKRTNILLGEYIPKGKLEEAFNEAWSNYSVKGIYFGLDKNFLTTQCGHYLIYGSELLCGIATKLMCRNKLKLHGKPAVITAKIPVDLISDGILQELLQQISCNFGDCSYIDFGFRVTEPLTPEYIEKIEYPTIIPDPLNCGAEYYYKGN